MKFRLAARSSEVGFRGPLIFQILFWPPGSKVFRKASLSLVNKHVSVLEKSALSNSLPYFVSFGYMSERLIPGTRRKENRYYYTSDSLWKIWLVESVQSIHNSLWTWHDKCNICCRYCIYHVKFTSVSVLLRNRMAERFASVSEDELWKMYNKTIIEFGFRMISWIIKTSCLYYLDNSWYHAQPPPIIV